MAAVHHSPRRPFLMASVSGEGGNLQSFGDNYVADNSDGGAAAVELETNSRTGSLDALRIFLDIC